MIRYEQSLAKAMHEDTSTINVYGVEIQVKHIPDEPRPGCFDPREFEFVKQAFEAGEPKEPTVQEMRDRMGFPNLNMNTVEIHTRYEEHNFDGNTVGIWIYRPRKPEGRTGRPGFIYLHGGGWIGGTTYTVENPCKLLAELADCVVFNIDYSLAPEKPYPNGLNDCFSALEYIYANAEKFGVDKNRIGMGGDSAGGNLTAACAIRDRDEGTNMLKYQALIYPAVTLSNTKIPEYEWKLEDFEMSPGHRAYIESGLLLGRPNDDDKSPLEIAGLYLQHGENLDDPAISPLLAKSHAGLCKALIAVAEFDGLRIQGEVYGKLMRNAGVDTRIIRYKGVVHAFFDKLGYLPQAEDLVWEMANDIKNL